MRGSSTVWVLLRAHILCGLAALFGLHHGFSAEPAPAPVEKTDSKKTGKAGQEKIGSLSLLACRQLALERAPSLAAARASLAAAQAREEALNRMGLASVIAHDLPVRRQQAALGVAINAAAVTQAEWDTLHGVTYSYLSLLYARKQRSVADEAIDRLIQLRDIAESIIKEGKRRDVSSRNLDTTNVYLLIARGRREDTVAGEERARSALREAMGLDAQCPLEIVAGDFKTAEPPARDALVAVALSRRGEIAQIANAAEVTGREVDAQQRSHRIKVHTFAAASDIHARDVPQALYTVEIYRPGALGLEMPPLLVGHKRDRVIRAEDYHGRTESVVEVTHKLITLEVEEAYYHWHENASKAARLRAAARAANTLANSLRDRFDPRVKGNVSMDDVLTAGVTATTTQISANEVDYRRLLALAELERDTAGGFDPHWELTPAANGNGAPPPQR